MIILAAPTKENSRFIKATYGIALKNIAKEIGQYYIFTSDKSGNHSTNEKTIIFQIETRESPEYLVSLKKRYPHSYVFKLCMDSPYCDFDKNSFANVDHHLNFLSDFVKKGQQFVKSSITFGTLSESMLRYFTSNHLQDKLYHIICMCNISTIQRYSFFQILSDKKFKIFTDLNATNLAQIKRLYEKSWCVLGHTMSPHENIYKRSMKLWRDWIGPCTNTIIIYDDHPTIIEYFDNIIPTYDYNNPYSFIERLYSFMVNPKRYVDILIKQQTWLKDNTIERQLLPLIREVI